MTTTTLSTTESDLTVNAGNTLDVIRGGDLETSTIYGTLNVTGTGLATTDTVHGGTVNISAGGKTSGTIMGIQNMTHSVEAPKIFCLAALLPILL